MRAPYATCLAIGLTLALTACGSQPAAPSSAAAKPGATAPGWDTVVAAAKREGQVAVSGPLGDAVRQSMLTFEKTYPEIPVTFVGMAQPEFAPKILSERQAGQYLWDVYVGGTGAPLLQFLPAGVLDPIKPALRPETMDNAKWLNGFDWGFIDREGSRVLSFAAYLNWSIYVNRDAVPEGQFTKLEDLLDPKYKSKISINEPREFSAGALHSAILIKALGEDRFRKFLAEQDVSVHKDLRQQVEWLVRGERPIGIGVQTGFFDDFRRQGLGLNVKPLDVPGGSGLTPGSGGCACLVNRAPHPNAARVYLDWFLSRDGQEAWNKATTANSRRLDIAPNDAATMPKAGVDYPFIEKEDSQYMRDNAMKLAREVLH